MFIILPFMLCLPISLDMTHGLNVLGLATIAAGAVYLLSPTILLGLQHPFKKQLPPAPNASTLPDISNNVQINTSVPGLETTA